MLLFLACPRNWPVLLPLTRGDPTTRVRLQKSLQCVLSATDNGINNLAS